MITKAIHQFTAQVNWGELDYLIIDLPPGTGDAQLSLTQIIKLDGVLIVTTPQAAAAQVAARGAQMFAKVDVPILGVIENMSYFLLPSNQQISGAEALAKATPFGQGGGIFVADELKVPLMAQLPIDGRLRELADKGQPVLASEAEGLSAGIYRELAREVAKIVGR